MANYFEFEVPERMKPQEVADTFTVYLLGPLALGENRSKGPFSKEGETNCWQLDGTNDFWLRVEGSTATISCRYEGSEESTIEAMVALFKLRFRLRNRAHAAA